MKDKSPFYAVILFLVWPLLSLVSAFSNYKDSWAKNILWAFIAFYGFVFAIGPESQGMDIVVYINEYQVLHNQTLSLSSAITYFQQSGEIDILSTFLAIVLSRFTDNASVLTLVYGIIFGFFFSRNIWFVLERLEGKIKLITILLLICLSLIIPIWNINGFRFWTAAHVFVYGALPFLFEGKKWGLVVSSLSILVHFSFLLPVGILILYLLIGNRLVIYFAFFLITFLISEINLTAFNNFIESYAPEALQDRSAGYRGEEYVEMHRENTNEDNNWYVVWYRRALSWSIMGFLVILFFKARNFFTQNRGWLNLFSFIFLFYGIANLFSSLPSGGRFIAIANLAAMALITLYIQAQEHELIMQRFLWLVTPALLLFIAVSIRIGLMSMSATTFLGNPVIAAFLMEEHISLNDFLRLLLG